jgi:glucose-6-phosphate 1-dehydrogenase
MLSIRLQPDEGMTLRVTIKEPGPGGMRLIDVPLDMTFAEALGRRGRHAGCLRAADHGRDPGQPDAVHARRRGRGGLGLDRSDHRGLDRGATGPSPTSRAASGPEEALMLLHRDGRRWREIG